MGTLTMVIFRLMTREHRHPPASSTILFRAVSPGRCLLRDGGCFGRAPPGVDPAGRGVAGVPPGDQRVPVRQGHEPHQGRPWRSDAWRRVKLSESAAFATMGPAPGPGVVLRALHRPASRGIHQDLAVHTDRWNHRKPAFRARVLPRRMSGEHLQPLRGLTARGSCGS